MYCKKCGAEITKKDHFCPKCGNLLNPPGNDFNRTSNGPKRKRVWIITFLFICLVGLIGGIFLKKRHDSDNQYLAVVKNEDGKYGFVNEDMEEIIECKYDIACGFNNGIAAVGEKVGDDLYRWGFINAKGKQIVPFKYDDVYRGRGCENGLMPVAVLDADVVDAEEDDYRWGFLNKLGEEIVRCQYLDFSGGHGASYSISNHEGMVCVGDIDGYYGIINSEGEEVIPCEYVDIGSKYGFRNDNNVIAVKKEINGEDRYGFINLKNEEVIPFIYEYAEDFGDNGLAAVRKDGLYGYIDKEGQEAIPFQFKSADSFSKNGLAVVKDEDGYYGYIDESGSVVIPCVYEYAFGFGDNNLAVIWENVGEESDGTGIYKDGLIDDKGEIIVEPLEYDSLYYYDEAKMILAEKEINGDYKYGYLDLNGNIVVEIEYDFTDYYGDNGLISVGYKREGTNQEDPDYYCQYIDKKGNVVIEVPKNYTYAGAFIKVR